MILTSSAFYLSIIVADNP